MHKIKSFHIPKIMLPFQKNVCYNTKVRRGVAQFGSALDWGSRGRKFKSCRSDHFLYSFAGGHAAFAKHPRGISSAGRAPGSQSGGQGFDPPMLHQVLSTSTSVGVFLFSGSYINGNQGTQKASALPQALTIRSLHSVTRYLISSSSANLFISSASSSLL